MKRLLVFLGAVVLLSVFSIQSHSVDSVNLPYGTTMSPGEGSNIGDTMLVNYTPPATPVGGFGFDKALINFQTSSTNYVLVAFYTSTTNIWTGTTTIRSDTLTFYGDGIAQGVTIPYDVQADVDSIYVKVLNETEAGVNIIPVFR